jgi:SecD/SecF fusion protein
MNKNLVPKSILIIVLVVVAAWTLYPPNKTLKPGIDLAGGTSLIYEIDAQGVEPERKKTLSTDMITVLRRRIDPANIQNLIWRPQGSSRFEIQMPLASVETRQKRQDFEKAKSDLLAENIHSATIMRCLQKPIGDRAKDFNDFAQGSTDRETILKNLATAYDERKDLQNKRDKLAAELETKENTISLAGLDAEQIKVRAGQWLNLNEQQLTEALKEFLGSESNLDLLTSYVNNYAEWAKVVDQLTDPESGKNVQYKNAKKELDKLNLTEDQINFVLEMDPKSATRSQAIEELKTSFADLAEKIDKVVAAYNEYRPFRGILDSPEDLKRMLKGAGILEFRILPTLGHPEVDADEMARYVESLKAKGPKYASDIKYVWCEIENIKEWGAVDGQKRPTVVAPFGDKYFVLASNKKDGTLLHGLEERKWKLQRAKPTTDRMGRRAIGFLLDERGKKPFANVTGKNIGRPLCILLDGIAISAPNIESRIPGEGIITGAFSKTEVEDMVNKLNAGSLPARLIEQPISEKSIGPSIGADNRDRGIKAGLIGFVVVVLCMAAYYMLAGSIADVALFMNLLFVLATMALLTATFTLPGIAGIILTIGMSVDANVLIFERIREEQQRGSSLRIAVRNGYQRAFRTILDANITTFITAAILYWVASEEVKGFAIVLMLGIVSSMFTALFVTRVIFDSLLAKRIIKDHLFMLQIIRKPNINWMALRPVFFCVSILLTAAGLFVFFTRDDVKNNKYDIEFTGGTSVRISLKNPQERQQVEDKIRKVGIDLSNPALAAANVYSIGKSKKQYEVNTTETNKTVVMVTFSGTAQQTIESITNSIKKAQDQYGSKLSNLIITAESESPTTFTIRTSNANKSLVKNILTTAFADTDADISEPRFEETVNNAMLIAFADELEIQQNLSPKITSQEEITEALIDSYPELADFLGGIKITCEIERAAIAEEIDQRIKDLRFKPDMQNLNWYSYKILDSDLTAIKPNSEVASFVYVSAEPEAGFRQLTDDEWSRFVENETTKVLTAAKMETLFLLTQFNPSIGAEAKTRALIAIVLSMFAIVAYIWIRFGNVRYGLAAITALVHDVCITLGAVTACTYITGTLIGEQLLIGDFKINLAMIAAFLTLIGYSLNDTIVVFDRIRENRRKARLNPQIITNSINQTISRTILTSFTTFIVVLIMYIFGGQALRGFTFAIGFGIIIGTYSSIAIAAPVLLLGGKAKKESRK